MAISSYAPHPAAARLWEEYLYGVTGANIRAESGAVPSTWQTMVKNGTASRGRKSGASRRSAGSRQSPRQPTSRPTSH